MRRCNSREQCGSSASLWGMYNATYQDVVRGYKLQPCLCNGHECVHGSRGTCVALRRDTHTACMLCGFYSGECSYNSSRCLCMHVGKYVVHLYFACSCMCNMSLHHIALFIDVHSLINICLWWFLQQPGVMYMKHPIRFRTLPCPVLFNFISMSMYQSNVGLHDCAHFPLS